MATMVLERNGQFLYKFLGKKGWHIRGNEPFTFGLYNFAKEQLKSNRKN